MDEPRKLVLGEKLTVRTLPGREGKPIARLPDGRVVLFDQNSEYFDMLTPGQSVEGQVIVISESYIILKPTSEPEKKVLAYSYQEVDDPEIDMHDIIKDLEKMIKRAEKKNAEIVPKALLRIIRLQQLNIKLIDELRRQG